MQYPKQALLITKEQIKPGLSLVKLDLEAFSKASSLFLKREIEKNGARFALSYLLNNHDSELCYADNGKPFIKNVGGHVSISHSGKWLLLSFNEKEETGVDVELVKNKVRNIQTKFLNENERLFASDNTEILTILWAAKEAVYKAFGQAGLRFAENIQVTQFSAHSTEALFEATVQTREQKKKYQLMYRKFLPYVMALVINEV